MCSLWFSVESTAMCLLLGFWQAGSEGEESPTSASIQFSLRSCVFMQLTGLKASSDIKPGQRSSEMFQMFSVISMSFMAVEDLGITHFLSSDWDI